MSGQPTRFTNGLTQDASTQPLGGIGIPDPFFYAYYDDDFLPYNSALYTITAGGGSVTAATNATASGPGGRIIMTNGTTAGLYTAVQATNAGIRLTAGVKAWYAVRMSLTSPITATNFYVGLEQVTTTPGTITDGILFNYVGATGVLTGLVYSSTGGGNIGTVVIPFAPTAGVDFDLAFALDRLGNISFYAGQNLIGNKVLQDGSTGVGGNFNPGPLAKLYQSNSVGAYAPALTGAFSTVLLAPMLAIGSSSTAGPAMQVDFQGCGMER